MLTRAEEVMDETAIKLSKTARETEKSFVVVLIDIERSKYYRKFDHRDLYSFLIDRCEVPKQYAYFLKRVVDIAHQYKEVEKALRQKLLNAAKASRLASSLTEQNQKELVEFAVSHTYDEVNAFARGIDCAKKYVDRLKEMSADQWRWTIDLTQKQKARLERVQAIEAQARRSYKRLDCFAAALEVYLDHRDKVRKAERARNRKPREAKPNSAVHRNAPLTAAQKHAVNDRDKGLCQYHDGSGRRCLSQSHVQSHHIINRSQGGSNEPDNLISVCWHHHDLIHQMEIPFGVDQFT